MKGSANTTLVPKKPVLGRRMQLGLSAALLVSAFWLADLCFRRAQIAAQVSLPGAQRAAIFLRVIAFERGFTSGTRPPLLAIVGSGREADEIAPAFASTAARFTVSGRRLRVVRLRSLSPAEAATLPAQGVGCVYLANPADVPLLAPAVAGAGVMVLCDANPACAVSLELAAGQPRVVVGMPAVTAARLDFDGRLLRTARIAR